MTKSIESSEPEALRSFTQEFTRKTRKITSVIAFVCNGKYYWPLLNKKVPLSIRDRGTSVIAFVCNGKYYWPLLNKKVPLSIRDRGYSRERI